MRDSGLLHLLLGIQSDAALQNHPKLGASWEGFVIELLLTLIEPDESYFWATHQGAEIDLVLRKHGRWLGMECKRTDAPRMTRSMTTALDDLHLEKIVVIYPGQKRFPIDRLASEGCIYPNAFSTAPICAPARAAVTTGMYPTSIGAHHMRTSRGQAYDAPAPHYVKCLGEYFRREGYYCSNNVKTDYQFAPAFTAWDDCSDTAHWRNRRDQSVPFFAVFNPEYTHESGMWEEKRTWLSDHRESGGILDHDPHGPEIPLRLRDGQGWKDIPVETERRQIDGVDVLQRIVVHTDPEIVYENPFRNFAINDWCVGHASEIMSIANAALNDEPAEYGIEGRKDVEMAMAIYESSLKGTAPVQLPLEGITTYEQTVHEDYLERFGRPIDLSS